MEGVITLYYLDFLLDKYPSGLVLTYGRLLALSNKGERECFLTNDEIMRITTCSRPTMLKIVQTLINDKFVFKRVDFSVDDKKRSRTFIINKNHKAYLKFMGKNTNKEDEKNKDETSQNNGLVSSQNLNQSKILSDIDKSKNLPATSQNNDQISSKNIDLLTSQKTDLKYRYINTEYKTEYKTECVHTPQKTETENLDTNKNNPDSESEKIETVEAEVLDNKKNSDEFNSFESVEKSESKKSNSLILPTRCKDFNKDRRPKPRTQETVRAYMEAFVKEHQAEKPNLAKLDLKETAESFFNWYEGCDWYQSKVPLKDWRMAASRWLNDNSKNPKNFVKNSTQGKSFDELNKHYEQLLFSNDQSQTQQKQIISKEPF